MNRFEEIKQKVESWEDEPILNREESEWLIEEVERLKYHLEKIDNNAKIGTTLDAVDALQDFHILNSDIAKEALEPYREE